MHLEFKKPKSITIYKNSTKSNRGVSGMIWW